jgi:hypothetical protein
MADPGRAAVHSCSGNAPRPRLRGADDLQPGAHHALLGERAQDRHASASYEMIGGVTAPDTARIEIATALCASTIGWHFRDRAGRLQADPPRTDLLAPHDCAARIETLVARDMQQRWQQEVTGGSCDEELQLFVCERRRVAREQHHKPPLRISSRRARRRKCFDCSVCNC